MRHPSVFKSLLQNLTHSNAPLAYYFTFGLKNSCLAGPGHWVPPVSQIFSSSRNLKKLQQSAVCHMKRGALVESVFDELVMYRFFFCELTKKKRLFKGSFLVDIKWPNFMWKQFHFLLSLQLQGQLNIRKINQICLWSLNEIVVFVPK